MGEMATLLPAWDLRDHPLPHSCIIDLSMYLDPENPLGNDWRMLAVHLGYDDSHIISTLELEKSPTECVLKIYRTQSELPTWQGLHKALRTMNRADAEERLVVHVRELNLSSESASDSLPVGWDRPANPQRTLRAKQLGHSCLSEVSKLLNVPHPLRKDWKLLADRLRYHPNHISQFELKSNKALALLQDFQCKLGATIGELCSALAAMPRFDVIYLLWKNGELTEEESVRDSLSPPATKSLPYTAYSDRPVLRQTARQMSEQRPRTARSWHPTPDDIKTVVEQLEGLGIRDDKARRATRQASRTGDISDVDNLFDRAFSLASDKDEEMESWMDVQMPPLQSTPPVMNITGGNVQIGNYNQIITTQRPSKKPQKSKKKGGGDARTNAPRVVPPSVGEQAPQADRLLMQMQETTAIKKDHLKTLGLSEKEINTLIEKHPEADANELANLFFEKAELSQQQPVDEQLPADLQYVDQRGSPGKTVHGPIPEVRYRGEGREIQPPGQDDQRPVPRNITGPGADDRQGAVGIVPCVGTAPVRIDMSASPNNQQVPRSSLQTQNLPADQLTRRDVPQPQTEGPGPQQTEELDHRAANQDTVGGGTREDIEPVPRDVPTHAAAHRDASQPSVQNAPEATVPTPRDQRVRFEDSEVPQRGGEEVMAGSLRTAALSEVTHVVPDSSLQPQTEDNSDSDNTLVARGIQAQTDPRRDDTRAAEAKSLKKHTQMPGANYSAIVHEEAKETPEDESFDKLLAPGGGRPQSGIDGNPDWPTGTYDPPQETQEVGIHGVPGQTDFDRNPPRGQDREDDVAPSKPGNDSEMDRAAAEDETDFRLRSVGSEPPVEMASSESPMSTPGAPTATPSEDTIPDVRMPSLQEPSAANEDAVARTLPEPGDIAAAVGASANLTSHQLNIEGEGEEGREASKLQSPSSLKTLETGVYVLHAADIQQITNNRSEDQIISSEGAFGPVYKGVFNGREVAVKILDTSGTHGEREYKREKSVAGVKHANILPVLGVCEDEGYPMSIVYPYMKNRDLAHQIKEKNPELTWQRRVVIAICLCRALHCLLAPTGDRKFKIYHRDIKSANVLLDALWRAYLGDTGLTREAAMEKSHLSMTGSQLCISGTRGYQDHVLILKPPNYYDDYCDIYSLGKVFMELLTNVLAQDKKDGDYMHNTWIDDGCLSDPDMLCELAVESSVGWPNPQENAVTKEFAEIVISCLNPARKKRSTTEDTCKKLEALAEKNNITVPVDK